MPFQNSAKVVRGPLLPPEEPTAMQASAEAHDTPLKPLPAATGLGLGTTDQWAPSQDSARVPVTSLLFPKAPTAMHKSAEMQDTLPKLSPVVPRFGLGSNV
jgi:hypothetical protein